MPFPSPADDYLERSLNLDDLIVHPSATYFVRMTGVAMEPTLHNGDILIVDRALTPLAFSVIVSFGNVLRAQKNQTNHHASPG